MEYKSSLRNRKTCCFLKSQRQGFENLSLIEKEIVFLVLSFHAFSLSLSGVYMFSEVKERNSHYDLHRGVFKTPTNMYDGTILWE